MTTPLRAWLRRHPVHFRCVELEYSVRGLRGLDAMDPGQASLLRVPMQLSQTMRCPF
jgi:hypothetical protein